MTRISNTLNALIEAERNAVEPSAEAAAACWAQISADFQRDSLPELDVPPVAVPSRPGVVWIGLVLGACALGAGAYAWHGPDSSEPAPLVMAAQPPVPETRILRAAEPAARPVPEEPEAVVEPVPTVPATTPPIPRSRWARGAEPAPEDTFAAELKLLAEGHAALNRGDAAVALRIAEKHKAAYPRGHFVEDREALRALARCASGDTSAARRFLQGRPRSIHAPRIREACGLPAAPNE